MPEFMQTAWDGTAYYATWYWDYAAAFWRDLSPLGYVSICFACLGCGYIMLKSSVKQLGK